MKMREESGKSGLKFNIQKTKIRASGPIPSWQKMGEKMETVTDCIFLGSKISHEIKRCFPWKKSYDKPRQHIKKQRYHFADKGPSSQSYGFSSSHVWICECESHLVVSVSLRPHELYNPWNSPGQNPGVGNRSLLQVIFTTQGSNPGLVHCRQILYHLSHKESPRKREWVTYPFSRGYF